MTRALLAPGVGGDGDRSRRGALDVDLESVVELLATLVEECRAPQRGERATVARNANRRAAEGVTVDVILAAHRNVLSEARKVVIATLRRHEVTIDEVQGILDVTLDALVLIEDIAIALAVTRVGRGDHLLTADQARRAVLEDLLAGGFLSDEEIVARAAEFGFDFTLPHAMVLVGPGGPERRRTGERRNRGSNPPPVPPVFRYVVERLSAEVRCGAVIPRMTAPIPHVVLLASCGGPREWPRFRALVGTVTTSEEANIIVVPPVSGPRELCKAYLEARDALPLAMLVTRRKRVIELDDLLIYQVLLGRPDDRQRFLSHVLGPVLAHPPTRRAALIDALQAFYDAGGDVALAAGRLHVHRNTVRYRLRRLEELTGLSVRHPRDLVWLFVALHLLAFSKMPDS